MRIRSLKSLFEKSNYSATTEFMENRVEDREIDSAISAKAQGFLKSLMSFEFYFILAMSIIIFDQIEILNTVLQKKDLCINDSHASVEAVLKNIENMRNEKIFAKIWRTETQAAQEIGIEEPCLPRSRNPSKRIDNKNNKTYVFSTPEEYFRKIYYEVLDTTITSLNTRFESETMNLLNKFENFILGDENIEVSEITNFYNIYTENQKQSSFELELDGISLKRERDLFVHTLNNDENFKKELRTPKQKSKCNQLKKTADEEFLLNESNDGSDDRLRLKHVILYLKENSNIRPLFSQLTKLVKLLLTLPGSSCTNERSFSRLRRLKNYLRSTMLQDRLNDISILNIYSDIANDIDNDSLLNKFIEKHNLRLQTFAVLYKNV